MRSHSLQTHMFYIHPESADHRKGEGREFGGGQEKKRERSVGDFEGLRSPGQCFDNKEEKRNLHDSP